MSGIPSSTLVTYSADPELKRSQLELAVKLTRMNSLSLPRTRITYLRWTILTILTRFIKMLSTNYVQVSVFMDENNVGRNMKMAASTTSGV